MWQIKIHQNIESIASHLLKGSFVVPVFNSFLKFSKQINQNNLEQGGSL